MEQALSFEGATGPYCQYAVTRLAAILRKAEAPCPLEGVLSEVASGDSTFRGSGGFRGCPVEEVAQKNLALKIAQLPEKIALAAQELRPSVVAQWCLEMAQVVSAFYRDVPVLSAESHKRESRLALVMSAKIALSNGLHLLGIPTPEEM